MCQDDVAQLCSQAKVAQQLAGRSQEAASGMGCTDTQVYPSATGPAPQAKERADSGDEGRWDGNGDTCQGTRPRGSGGAGLFPGGPCTPARLARFWPHPLGHLPRSVIAQG